MSGVGETADRLRAAAGAGRVTYRLGSGSFPALAAAAYPDSAPERHIDLVGKF